MAVDASELTDLLDQCSQGGLRQTVALRACLQAMLAARQPLTLQEIAASPAFDVSCDPATVYRLIIRLEEKRIVRRIGFHSRAAHYLLRRSHHHQDYLICRDCGTVAVLDISCPVRGLEEGISKSSGFTDLEHELEFFGTCAHCR